MTPIPLSGATSGTRSTRERSALTSRSVRPSGTADERARETAGEEGTGMSTPPSGTVTFLFTDIEGSARLWEDHPESMRAALARHDQILNDAIACNGGFVVK